MARGPIKAPVELHYACAANADALLADNRIVKLERTGVSQSAVRGSAGLDVRGLLALRSAHDFELNLLAFFEALEAIHLNRAKVCEQIFAAVVRGDEPVTFGVIEPFDSTSSHIQAIPRKTLHDPHHLMDAQIALTSELSVPQDRYIFDQTISGIKVKLIP